MLLAFACLPASAQALEATAARTPADITYWGPGDDRTTREVVHTLHLRAGDAGEQMLVTVGALDSVTLVGPGALEVRGAGSALSIPRPPLPGRDACPTASTRGGGYGIYRLELPAGATSTLTYTERVDFGSAPRDPAQFTATWSLAPQDDAGEGTAPAVRVTEQAPRLLGLQASALTLRVGRTSSGIAIDDRETLTTRPRTDLTFSGTLSHARRGERIVVRGFAPGATRPTTIGTARTDRHGRFLLRHWRPRRAGLWELYATYAGRPGLVEATRSPCSGPRVTIDG